jgi:transcriptional regulator with XRE-family HTH domain
LWTGDLVKAFREQMGWTQIELADKLGMRQQTISEWETGLYEPKRSTSKFLTMFAEQAGFKYGESESLDK